MFENAKWIANYACPAEACPVFRKKFTVSGKTDSAVLAICGLGFYVFTLNGERVTEDLLTPPFTNYSKRLLYQEYDIAPYLRTGENVLEVTLGNGWFHVNEPDSWHFEAAAWKLSPRMICEIRRNGETVLVSDPDFETAVSKTVYSSLRCGESVDATQTPAFHKAALAMAPAGKLYKQDCPPVRAFETYDAVPLGEGIYDFGYNISGNVVVKASGKAGDWIVIQYGERLRRDEMELDRERITENAMVKRFAEDQFVLSGNGEETFCIDFTYYGFRYIYLQTSSDDVKISSLRAREIHTALPRIGDYTTDNADINRYHNACTRSTLSNYVHIPTDCPHREKNGWTADAMLSSEQTLFHYDMDAAYRKWLFDIVDCQRESGQIPCIAPTGPWGYEWGSGVTWDAALFVIPYRMYLYRGDKSVFEPYYEPMKKYLAYLRTLGVDNIYNTGLGDWAPPYGTPPCPPAVLITAMAKVVFGLFAKIAALCGHEADARAAEAEARAIRESFIRHFPLSDAPTGLCYYTTVLAFDLTDDKKAALEALKAELARVDYKLFGGIFTVALLPKVLREYGETDLAWKVAMRKDYGYYGFICDGETLGEKLHGGPSHNHHMYSTGDAFFETTLSGLWASEKAPGFRELHLRPYFPSDVHTFSCYHTTPYGKIEISWNDTIYTVVLPDGISGDVQISGKTTPLHAGKNEIRR